METCSKPTQNPHQLLRLTREQQQDPLTVLACFFECYHLKDLRELLWDWLLTALSTDNATYAKGRDRSNLIFLYEKIELLTEAAWIIYQQPSAKKHKRKRKK